MKYISWCPVVASRADEKSPYDGMLRVVKFNWPLYAAAFAAVLMCLCFALMPQMSSSLRILSGALAILATYQTVASLVASHSVYDLSIIKGWRWLPDVKSGDKLNIVNVHSGYDETSGALCELFPQSQISVIDLYPSLKQREPSIARARALYPPKSEPICTTVSGWPVADHSVDLILIALAAHELREPALREELFGQVKSVLAPDGRVVLVEHLRDLANFAAFGPGFLHFIAESEWRRCIGVAGLQILKCYRITPLVGVFILCP
jgi:SAM-dependent methyltransferase